MPVEMTISQALRRIAKLKGELAKNKTLAEGAVSFDVRKKPAFTFAECAEKISSIREELLNLQTKVAVANAMTVITIGGKNMPLAEAARRLQELKGEIAWLNTLSVREQADTVEESWNYDEDMKRVKTTVQWQCALPKAKQVEAMASLQEKFDELNNAVETMNHRTLLKG